MKCFTIMTFRIKRVLFFALMKNVVLVLMSLFGMQGSIMCQKLISGTVVDDKQEPISGVVVIQEGSECVSFGKGAYSAQNGNFNTAGFADFKSKNQLESNLFQLEYGRFNSLKTLGMFKLVDQKNTDAYVAAEYISRDGFFESPQNFHRVNLQSKLSKTFDNGNLLEASVSFFDSEWTASGQIPERAIRSGLISRLGAIDDTEGGKTSRKSINFKETIFLGDKSHLKGGVYLSQYDFELFSNFTFFLDDSEFGDQIKQSESRVTCGAFVHLGHELSSDLVLKYGANFRNDKVSDIQLTNTINRETIQDFVALGNVAESNISSFFTTDYKKGNWKFTPGVRLDYFDFNYTDKLETTPKNLEENSVLFSPKFITSYTPNKKVQFALKLGQGFHSNDTRVAVLNGSSALPKSTGGDLEVNWKVNSKIILTSAVWFLDLEQEFVYVGDAGIVEPSGRSKRKGVDVSARIELKKGLLANFDFNYTHARSSNGESFSERIPLAPELTSTGGFSYVSDKGFFGSLNYRYLGDRAANEDFSSVAKGYLLLDGSAGYKSQHIEFSVGVENALNTDWKEAQFLTLSRLQFEETPVEEIHFTPGTPFFLNAKIGFRF